MKTRSRIEMHDSMQTAIVKMADGNIGAVTVLMEMLKQGGKIDPYTDPLILILHLDDMGVYGSRIWMLYKDVCGQNLSKTLALVRARQLGFVSEVTLLHAINNHGHGIDVPDLCRQVKERLPDFNLEA